MGERGPASGRPPSPVQPSYISCLAMPRAQISRDHQIARLVGRFILEDPDGKPVGTILHVDRAQFENEDMGGYLLMTQPPGGFPVGNYRVEIHYENITDMSLLTLARFKVVPAAGAAGQKP